MQIMSNILFGNSQHLVDQFVSKFNDMKSCVKMIVNGHKWIMADSDGDVSNSESNADEFAETVDILEAMLEAWNKRFRLQTNLMDLNVDMTFLISMASTPVEHLPHRHHDLPARCRRLCGV